MDRRNTSKAGERGGGGNFHRKACRKACKTRDTATSYSSPPPIHSRNHSTFFTSRFSLDRYKNSIASGKRRIPIWCLTYLERAQVGRFPSRRGPNATRILCFSPTIFFFFFFHFLGRGGTETIASNVKSLLILPTNSFLVSFVSFACTVLFDHLLFIIIMIIVSIRICYISMLHRYNKARLFLYLPLPPPPLLLFFFYIYIYIFYRLKRY